MELALWTNEQRHADKTAKNYRCNAKTTPAGRIIPLKPVEPLHHAASPLHGFTSKALLGCRGAV